MIEHTCASFTGVFDMQQILAMRLLGERASAVDGRVENAPDSHRQCSVAWLEPSDWLAEKLSEVVEQINAEFFGFDLGGFAEPFQYTVYREGGYYGWHMDKGNRVAPRKLSLTIQLSASDEYDGGNFQIDNGSEILELGRDQGRVFAFPSWVLHQVTPVSRGVRRSLVVWVHGEPFR